MDNGGKLLENEGTLIANQKQRRDLKKHKKSFNKSSPDYKSQFSTTCIDLFLRHLETNSVFHCFSPDVALHCMWSSSWTRSHGAGGHHLDTARWALDMSGLAKLAVWTWSMLKCFFRCQYRNSVSWDFPLAIEFWRVLRFPTGTCCVRIVRARHAGLGNVKYQKGDIPSRASGTVVFVSFMIWCSLRCWL